MYVFNTFIAVIAQSCSAFKGENNLQLQESTEISRTVWTWTLCAMKKRWTLSAILWVASTFCV